MLNKKLHPWQINVKYFFSRVRCYDVWCKFLNRIWLLSMKLCMGFRAKCTKFSAAECWLEPEKNWMNKTELCYIIELTKNISARLLWTNRMAKSCWIRTPPITNQRQIPFLKSKMLWWQKNCRQTCANNDLVNFK